MNNFLFPSFIILAALLFLGYISKDKHDKLTQYGDPRIGAGGHRHVFVGAGMTLGLVQAGLINPTVDWDRCPDYHYSDSVLKASCDKHQFILKTMKLLEKYPKG
jgi:hypothetical protein